MVSFRVEAEIRAPPPFVVDWWLDFSPQDAALTAGMVGRDVVRIDDHTVRLTTHAEVGGRIRTTVGTVVRTGPATWQMSAHVFSEGVIVSTLHTTYSVVPTPDGSRVLADFELAGRTRIWRLLLYVSRYYLRRGRRRSFGEYARAIEAGFAAQRTSAATDSPGAPSPPAGPPPP